MAKVFWARQDGCGSRSAGQAYGAKEVEVAGFLLLAWVVIGTYPFGWQLSAV
jgi:hypothetical protein